MESEHDGTDYTDDQDPDDTLSFSVFQSSFSNHNGPKGVNYLDLPPHTWQQLPASVKQLVIDHNKKLKRAQPKSSTSQSGKPKLKPPLSKPTPPLSKSNTTSQQTHLHDKHDLTSEENPDNHPQAMVHECQAACDTDPSDIQNVMSLFHANHDTTSTASPRQIQVHQRYVLPGLITPPTILLIQELMKG